LTRLCLLNTSVTPNVFADTSVNLYAALQCANSAGFGSEERCA
jgi:hypothetical protein